MAQNATAALWQLGEFNGQGNDGIVAVTSQLRSTITSSQFVGIVHSAGTVQIGFAGPFELQAVSRPEFFSDIQQAVVSLLNASADTSASGALFQLVP